MHKRLQPIAGLIAGKQGLHANLEALTVLVLKLVSCHIQKPSACARTCAASLVLLLDSLHKSLGFHLPRDVYAELHRCILQIAHKVAHVLNYEDTSCWAEDLLITVQSSRTLKRPTSHT